MFGIMGAITSLVGIGTSVYASEKEAGLSQQYYGLSQEISQTEGQENYQRYLAMIYGNNRQQMENLRKAQQTQAAAREASVGAGAQFTSAAAGAQSQISAQAGWNTEGLSQARQTGTALYNLSNQITGLQTQQAGIQTQMADWQGIAAIGQGITQAGQVIGKLS